MNLAISIASLAILGSFGEILQERDFDDLSDDPVDFENGTETLRLVQVLYRHGDRSQTHNYTNDIYKESDWPQGYGQLSKEGMRQEFLLGEFLRQSYVDTGFLNADYTRTELYVRSTAYDRALMSAYSVLAALYPPIQEDQQFDLNIAWQPIPVHNVPMEEDYLLVFDFLSPVQQAAGSAWTLEKNSTMEKTMEEYSEFYDLVSEMSGEPRSWEGIKNVLDPIFCQAANNFTLPEWVTDDILNQIIELRDVYSTVSGLPREYAYLKGGTLVGEMFDHMINKSRNDSSPSQKLFMYSAHDSTLLYFLMTLGIFNNKQPPYTACVIVELHEIQQGEFAVQFLYKNETGEPYILKIPDCEELCPLEVFAQIVEPSIPRDLRKACGLAPINSETFSPFESSSNSIATVTVIILICLILVLFIIVIVLCFVKRDKLANTHDYMPVPVEMTPAE